MEGIVTQTIQNNSTEIHAIEFSGTPSHPETFTIHSTAGHPFWVENLQSWQDASALEPGMQILLVDGSTVDVISNSKSTTDSRVYNFSVHQYENYFAGDLGVLVHNAKCDITKVSPNTINHIFGKPMHKLDNIVKTYGSNSQAMSALVVAVNNSKIALMKPGLFQEYVTLAGQNVMVRGNIIGDQIKIATAFIP